MSNVTTTLVVTLRDADADGSSIFRAEIDPRDPAAGGLNADDSFAPGANVGYLLYGSSNVDWATLLQLPSIGSITGKGVGTRVITETIRFANEKEASPSYPVTGGFSYKWFGNNLGVITPNGDRQLTIPAEGVGVAEITYTTTFRAYLLTGTMIVGEPEYDVLVYVEAALK